MKRSVFATVAVTASMLGALSGVLGCAHEDPMMVTGAKPVAQTPREQVLGSRRDQVLHEAAREGPRQQRQHRGRRRERRGLRHARRAGRSGEERLGRDGQHGRHETGADFIMSGWVVSQNDSDGGGRSIKAFVTTMELTDVRTQKKVWLNDKKIKKQITRSAVAF